MLNYKFLAPCKFSIIKNIYDFNYFTINSVDEIGTCLKFRFTNDFKSYMFIPKNIDESGLITFPNFLIKNIDAIHHSIDDSLEFVNECSINDLNIKVFKSDLSINNVNFMNLPEENQTNRWLSSKNEITEHEYYYGSQIIHTKLYPSQLRVLGVTINSELEGDITKSKLQLFSLPGVIANYLMQLKYQFKNIISHNFLFEYQDNENNNYYRFYDVLIDFDSNNILYSSSIKNYEKVIQGKKDLKLNTENDYLNNFKIYSKREWFDQYLLCNKSVTITKTQTLKDIYDRCRRFFYIYSHIDNDLLKEDLVNTRLKHKAALVRIMNPELRYYEAGVNWSFDNLDSPKRYLVVGDYFYDSYSGLGYNRESQKFDLSTPSIDWGDVGKIKGTWSNYPD